MRLSDAFFGEQYIGLNLFGYEDCVLKGLTCDSRRVEPGFLFVAISGAKTDGASFIPEAILNGAIAILAEESVAGKHRNLEIPLVLTVNSRRSYAELASRFHGPYPNTIVAVTGTNGKTSTVSFLRQIWAKLGLKSGSVGTLGVELEGVSSAIDLETIINLGLTTPDSVELCKIFTELSRNNVEHLAIEASSHGLDQFRLDGLNISAAAFTNLSHDHLDYHGSFKKYFAAKKRLFSELMNKGGLAVFNADDDYATELEFESNAREHRVLSYGINGKSVRLVSLEPMREGQNVVLEVFGERHKVYIPLVGHFQIANSICALTLAIGLGCSIEKSLDALATLNGVLGRVQLVGKTDQLAPIYVDYAHSPASLLALLTTLRPYVAGKMYLVFGCGGERDIRKRQEMGKIASNFADRVIVTDDNPRLEDANTIRSQILMSCIDCEEIGDRKLAIKTAIKELRMGDLLVIAGKGHESGQIIGTECISFNDAAVVREVLQEQVK